MCECLIEGKRCKKYRGLVSGSKLKERTIPLLMNKDTARLLILLQLIHRKKSARRGTHIFCDIFF